MNQNAPSGILRLFAEHRVAANLLMIIVFLSGYWALRQLNTQFFPNFDIDYISIIADWPGASAEDVERSLTVPVEQVLRNLDYVKEITSTSAFGFTSIALEYEEGTDMLLALERVKEAYTSIRNLPPDAEEPEIVKVENYEPIASLLISGPEHLDELRPWVRRFETELLNRGIAKIDIDGLPEEEMAIQIPSHTLQQLGLTLDSVASRINALSRDRPAGTLGQDDVAHPLRSLQQKRSEQDFRQLIIHQGADGQRLTLADIAEIERRPKDNQALASYQGTPAVRLILQRTTEANALTSAEVLHTWLAETTPTLPANLSIQVYDQNWQYIEDRINLLLKNGASGLLLVVLILFLFLNGRVAFWVALGIPISFMASLIALYALGGSINMITLFAFIMSLGIIVDDAIVVGENTFTHSQKGEPALLAAVNGARRMFVPVMSSSLTTVAAFAPLMLIGGIIGNILFAIPLIVICVIIASLLECFLILPGHLHHSLKGMRAPGRFRQRFDAGFAHFRNRRFRPLLVLGLNNPLATLMLAFGLFILSATLVGSGRVNFTFFPTPESGFINANVQFTPGSREAEVKAFMDHLEETLLETNQALGGDLLVSHLVLQRRANFSGESFSVVRGDRYASMDIELVSPDQRNVDNQAFIQAWRSRVQSPAGLEAFSLAARRGGPPGKDIEMRLSGKDANQLKLAALELQEELKRYSGVNNIEDDLPYGNEQWLLELTATAYALGLTPQELTRQLGAAFDGRVAQIFNQDQEEVEVRVMLPDAQRRSLATLNQLPISTPSGNSVPLSEVATIHSKKGLEILRHQNGQLSVKVIAEVDSSLNNANKILEDLQADYLPELLNRYNLSFSLDGRAQDQAETLADMGVGALLALAAIYITLAWVFSAYLWPLAVMAAIPFGLTGAIFGHWLLGMDMTILSLFGFFGLAGIVINDAIILVTFYKELRQQGLPIRQGLEEAACQRLRAVLLTSLTTIAGLLPLLFETSLQAQFLIPMAVSICFGLAIATLLVLIVIPCLLLLIERTNQWTQSLLAPA